MTISIFHSGKAFLERKALKQFFTPFTKKIYTAAATNTVAADLQKKKKTLTCPGIHLCLHLGLFSTALRVPSASMFSVGRRL